MYKKSLESARTSYEMVSRLEDYGKEMLFKDTKKYRDVAQRIRLDSELKNKTQKEQQAKHLISLSFMQKIGAIKEERKDKLNEVIKVAEETKNTLPKATPEQIVEYRDRVNYLKTEILLANKHDEKKNIIQDFIKDIDNPELAAELRREFGTITRDIIDSVQGGEQLKARLMLRDYYNDLKDGIKFYPEEVQEIIQLARKAETTLEQDRLFNQVFAETNTSHLLSKEQLAYLENPYEYIQTNYPELMVVNVSSKLDSTIEDTILKPETEEMFKEVAVSSLLR